MKKIFIYGIISAVSLLFFYIVYQLIKVSPCTYDRILGNNPEIVRLFNDSIVKDLKLAYSFGNKTDKIYSYNYKYRYSFVFWDIADFNKIDITKINVKNDLHDDIQKDNFGIMDLSPLIKMNFKTPFSINKQIYLGSDSFIGSKLVDRYVYYSCKGNELNIFNDQGKNQINICSRKRPIYLMFFKWDNKIYLFFMASLKDESILTESPEHFLKLFANNK